KPLTKAAVDLFRKTRKETKISAVLIHTNYLINLAAADETILLKSIASFREEVERAILLGVDYLVLHPGSARGSSESDAIKMCARCISTIRARRTTRASIVTGTLAKVILEGKRCDVSRSIRSFGTRLSFSKRLTTIRARI